jgi:hypothetical protein
MFRSMAGRSRTSAGVSRSFFRNDNHLVRIERQSHREPRIGLFRSLLPAVTCNCIFVPESWLTESPTTSSDRLFLGIRNWRPHVWSRENIHDGQAHDLWLGNRQSRYLCDASQGVGFSSHERLMLQKNVRVPQVQPLSAVHKESITRVKPTAHFLSSGTRIGAFGTCCKHLLSRVWEKHKTVLAPSRAADRVEYRERQTH